MSSSPQEQLSALSSIAFSTLTGIPVNIDTQLGARHVVSRNAPAFWNGVAKALIEPRLFGFVGPGNKNDYTPHIPGMISLQLQKAQLGRKPQDVAAFLERGEQCLWNAIAQYATNKKSYDPTVLEGLRYTYQALIERVCASDDPSIKPGADLFWHNMVTDGAKREKMMDRINGAVDNTIIGIKGLMPLSSGDSSFQIWHSVISKMNNQLPNISLLKREEYIQAMEQRCRRIIRHTSDVYTMREVSHYLFQVIQAQTNDTDMMSQMAVNLSASGTNGMKTYWEKFSDDICDPQYGATSPSGSFVYDAMKERNRQLAVQMRQVTDSSTQSAFLRTGKEVVRRKSDEHPGKPALAELQKEIEGGFNGSFTDARQWREQDIADDPETEIASVIDLLTNPITGIGTRQQTQSVEAAQARWNNYIATIAKETVSSTNVRRAYDAMRAKILEEIEKTDDEKKIKHLVDMYQSATLGENGVIASFQPVANKYIRQIARDLSEQAAHAQPPTNPGKKLDQYDHIDASALAMKPDWVQYFSIIRNPKLQQVGKIVEITEALQEAKLKEMAKRHFGISGAYLKAGILAIFDEWKDPANTKNGDYKNKLVFYALHLLTHSAIADQLRRNEETREGQKATATILDIQTWFVAQVMRDNALQKAILPFIEQRTDKPKDQDELLLWMLIAVTSRDQKLQMQVENDRLTCPKSTGPINSGFTASIENASRELAQGNSEAVFELLAAWRSFYPIVVAAQGELTVLPRMVKNTRKSGDSPLRATVMRILREKTYAVEVPDGIFYEWWEAAGKPPNLANHPALVPPRRERVIRTLNRGYAIAGNRNMLEYLLRTTGDTCMVLEPPGIAALGRNYGDWEKQNRKNLLSQLVKISEDIIHGEKFNTADNASNLPYVAASLLYTIGLALKEWKSEDPRMKDILANSMNSTLVKIIGEEGKTDCKYSQPVIEMAWEVVEQCIPYWSKEHRAQFMDTYMGAALRDIKSGGLNQYGANGKLYKLMRYLAIRADTELPPVPHEVQSVVSGNLGGIQVRQEIASELGPYIAKIVQSYTAWHIQDMNRRLYRTLPGDINWGDDDVPPSAKEVKEQSIVGQALLIAEAILPKAEVQEIVDAAMRDTLDQRASALLVMNTTPNFVRAGTQAWHRSMEELLNAPAKMMSDAESILGAALPLLLDPEIDFDPATRSLVVKNIRMPGGTAIEMAKIISPKGGLSDLEGELQASIDQANTPLKAVKVDVIQGMFRMAQTRPNTTLKSIIPIFQSMFGSEQRNRLSSPGVGYNPLGSYAPLVYYGSMPSSITNLGIGDAVSALMNAGTQSQQQMLDYFTQTGATGFQHDISTALVRALVKGIDNKAALIGDINTLKSDAMKAYTEVARMNMSAIRTYYEALSGEEQREQNAVFDRINKIMESRRLAHEVQLDLMLAAMKRVSDEMKTQSAGLAKMMQETITADFKRQMVQWKGFIGLVDPGAQPYNELLKTWRALYMLSGCEPAVSPMTKEQLGIA